MAEGRLKDRVALVTGASSGIGRATAEALVREGARVAMVSRRAPELEAVRAELGGAAFAYPADVSDSDQVAAMVARVDAELDGIDVVVNCAGLVLGGPLADTADADWRAVIDSNLSGSYYVSREAGLRMAAGRGGAIVNLGSEASMQGMEGLTAYCAAKFGIIGLTKALAVELAPAVRVNAVCPGPTETPMLLGFFDSAPDPQALRDGMLSRINLNRFGDSDDVAEGILYMLTAPHATGAVLNLDGGSTL